MAIGIAGPASAISLIQTPLAVALTILIDGQTTNMLQVASMILSLVGTVVIL